MAIILPPQAQTPNLPASVPAANAQSVPTATATTTTPSLSALTTGAQLQAEIVEILARGTATVATDAGTFQIRTNVALNVGATLDLELLKTGQRPQFAVRAAGGEPLAQQAARPTSGASDVLQGSRTQAAAAEITDVVGTPPAIELKPGAIIRAAVLRAAPQFADPAALLQQTGAQDGLAKTISTPLQTALEALPAGSLLDLKIADIGKPPTSTLPQLEADGATATLKGTFTGVTPEGRPIVETPAATLALNTSLVPEKGSTIAFTDPNELRSQWATAPAPLQGSVVKSLVQTHSWPALEQAVAHLERQAQPDPQAAAQTQNVPLPRPNSLLANNLLTFVNALGRGDIHDWLGAVANTLQDQRPDLAGPLREQFAELSQTFNASPPPDGWRTAIIPFFIGGPHPEAVQMHLRGGSREKAQRKEDESARFIIDVTLTKLGRIQLDGLVKDRGKAFDLIVRTQSALPQRMRRDINRIFSDFEEAAGIRGAVIFQASNKFVEVALSRLAPTSADGLLV